MRRISLMFVVGSPFTKIMSANLPGAIEPRSPSRCIALAAVRRFPDNILSARLLVREQQPKRRLFPDIGRRRSHRRLFRLSRWTGGLGIPDTSEPGVLLYGLLPIGI